MTLADAYLGVMFLGLLVIAAGGSMFQHSDGANAWVDLGIRLAVMSIGLAMMGGSVYGLILIVVNHEQ